MDKTAQDDQNRQEAAEPLQCWRCGSLRVIPIVFGLPDVDLWKAQRIGGVMLGGCTVTDDDPEWFRQGCEHVWRPVEVEGVSQRRSFRYDPEGPRTWTALAQPRPLDDVLSHLKGVRKLPGPDKGWVARCPAGGDPGHALSVQDGDGLAIVHCHGRCSPGAVLIAINVVCRRERS